MTTVSANAFPTKQFFIRSITRDLTLDDAILDLVDNSIDAYIRMRNLDVSPDLLRREPESRQDKAGEPPVVQVTVTPERIEVRDYSGGISVEDARRRVFRFGRVDPDLETSLGVYGVGLKRAIFKMGKRIHIESRTTTEGFKVDLDVTAWAADDVETAKQLEQAWTIPLELIGKAKSADQAGTTITITDLNPEVALRVKDPTLLTRLFDSIGTTYTLFLQHYLDVSLNGKPVPAKPLLIGGSEDIRPGFRELVYGPVSVELIAGLAARVQGQWNVDRAGWYVLCNGRVVVSADKTDLTGWGVYAPQFVSKYRGFIGVAFFFSKQPGLLPWTTTKRGLNQESEVYLRARQEMTSEAKPVLSFLNDMYSAEPAEHPVERRQAEALAPVALRAIATSSPTNFTVRATATGKRPATTSIQFSVDVADVERARKCAKRSSWSNGAIGRYAFEYFLKMECPQ